MLIHVYNSVCPRAHFMWSCITQPEQFSLPGLPCWLGCFGCWHCLNRTSSDSMQSSPSPNAHLHTQKSCTGRLAIEFLQQQCQLILPSFVQTVQRSNYYVRNVAETCIKVGQPENNVIETSSSRNLAGQLWPTWTHACKTKQAQVNIVGL